jgi:hypothetical protein
LSELKRKAGITKSAQFAAAKRIEKLSIVSVVAISVIATLSIGIGAISIIFSDRLDADYIKILGVASILVSIYIIFISVLVASRAYDRKSFLLAASARRISEVINDINCIAEKDYTIQSVKKFHRRYNQILSDFESDHDDIDFRFASIEYHQDGRLRKIMYAATYRFYPTKIFMYYLAFPIVTMILLVVILIYFHDFAIILNRI